MITRFPMWLCTHCKAKTYFSLCAHGVCVACRISQACTSCTADAEREWAANHPQVDSTY